MSWKPILDLLDLGILLWIALMERAALQLEKLNHTLYSNFFTERSKWYSARNKKAPETSGGDAIVEVVREVQSNEEAS